MRDAAAIRSLPHLELLLVACPLMAVALAQCLWSFDDLWFFLLPIPLAILALVWLALVVRSILARFRETRRAAAVLSGGAGVIAALLIPAAWRFGSGLYLHLALRYIVWRPTIQAHGDSTEPLRFDLAGRGFAGVAPGETAFVYFGPKARRPGPGWHYDAKTGSSLAQPLIGGFYFVIDDFNGSDMG